METIQSIITPPKVEPGVGKGWTILAESVARELDVTRLSRIWVFSPLRRNEREWGTAVVAVSVGEDRLEIHTARYFLVTRGKKRGQNKVEVEIVAESPADVVSEVLEKVQERTGETDPPVEINVLQWYPPIEEVELDDEPSTEG
jgi:hypothetical protein